MDKRAIKMRGIDVSAHQGVIDWQKVKASGLVDFAIIRAGFGRGNNEGQAVRNIKEALKNNIAVGAYWFCYALTPQEAIWEAEECLRLIKPFKGQLTMPICYDLEASGVDTAAGRGSEEYAAHLGQPYTKESRTAIAQAFLDRVEREGYFAMFYANWDYLENRYLPNSMERYDLWLASPRVDPYRPCGIWQYDWHGKVPGIAGEVDLNYAFYDYPKIIKAHGLNGFTKPAEPAEPTEPAEPIKIEKEYLVEIPFKTAEDRERFLTAIGRARKSERTLTPEKILSEEVTR